jgi:predicted transposase YbfD/YdcC
VSLVINLLDQFQDPRDPKKVWHPLSSILFISICAIFSGAEGWEDIVTWAEVNKKWLSKHVNLSKGIPSYSTIRRIFIIVSPACWGQLIRKTVSHNHPEKVAEDHVSIDGKTLRGSKCEAKDISAMQIVHAWSIENNIILGEVKTDSKSNEITAIPLLLELLDLEGATVSIDAMGCNEKIISAILKKGAHYLLGLKKNQPKLYEAVETYTQNKAIQRSNLVKDYFDNSHGRSVRRRYFAFDVPDDIRNLGFTKMNTIIATETISTSKYKKGTTAEWRYYVTDHDKMHEKLPTYIRGHWQVESMHWCLDVHLNDDRDKKYVENAAENFAKTKRFLLNLVKSKPPRGKKRSLRSNLKLVGWDLDYLVKLLFS